MDARGTRIGEARSVSATRRVQCSLRVLLASKRQEFGGVLQRARRVSHSGEQSRHFGDTVDIATLQCRSQGAEACSFRVAWTAIAGRPTGLDLQAPEGEA